MAVLDQPSDFESTTVAKFDTSKFLIKSVSKIQINLSVSLPTDL